MFIEYYRSGDTYTGIATQLFLFDAEMDTDEDLKPPLGNVTNTAVNAPNSNANGTSNSTSSAAPLKMKDEIKEEPMDVESAKTAQEKKHSSDKDKRPGDDVEIPMVNGTLSDSDKEQEMTVSMKWTTNS